MIKLMTRLRGKKTILLGLTGENITRMMAKEPALIDLAPFGLEGQLVLCAGTTSRDILVDLVQAGIVEQRILDEYQEPAPGQETVWKPT